MEGFAHSRRGCFLVAIQSFDLLCSSLTFIKRIIFFSCMTGFEKNPSFLTNRHSSVAHLIRTVERGICRIFSIELRIISKVLGSLRKSWIQAKLLSTSHFLPMVPNLFLCGDKFSSFFCIFHKRFYRFSLNRAIKRLCKESLGYFLFYSSFLSLPLTTLYRCTARKVLSNVCL